MPWLREVGHPAARLEELAGDVSARRYARVHFGDDRSAILASYPLKLRDSCRRFTRTTGLLDRVGVAVPGILAVDCDRGLMLLEDAGERTLFDLRRQPLTEQLPSFELAIELAAKIATIDPEEAATLNPLLGADLLRSELQQTIDVFLEPGALLGDTAERRALEHGLDRLCEALGAARPVPCHRDFMSRNLVPSATGELLVLDHQDLRLGPPGYDLASLLNDSFFPPHDVESALVATVLTDGTQRLAYHRAAAQRALKAVGTFAAFAARGFERHLPLIPPTLSRALHHLALTPEASSLASALAERWAPATEPAERGSSD